MARKVKRALEQLAAGNFTLPSPREIEASKTPAGSWTALQLAKWGVPWPPRHGWKAELERKWEAANNPHAGTLPLMVSGIGRDEEAPRGAALTFYFNRRPTDDEMRAIHDAVREIVNVG
jgi:hypothetical protein